MAEYYVDADASGSDDGSTPANAWSTLQRAIDGTDGTQPSAGDVVLLRHGTGIDQVVTATTDFDGNSGDRTNGRIIYRGVNSSWVNDGTRYVIDANDNTIDILNTSTSDYISLENVEVRNNTGSFGGIVGNTYLGSIHWAIINCYVHDVYYGIECTNLLRVKILKCRIEDCRNHGIYNPRDIYVVMCHIKNNGDAGLYSVQPGCKAVIGCYITENSGEGIDINMASTSDFVLIKNNVIHGNTNEGVKIDNMCLLIGNRITANSVGISVGAAGIVTAMWNYMPDTGEDEVNTTKTSVSGELNEIVIDGSNSNNFSGTDTDGGYTDPDNDDYNLTDTATLRRVEVDLEV
jgi:hypothetical protein